MATGDNYISLVIALVRQCNGVMDSEMRMIAKLICPDVDVDWVIYCDIKRGKLPLGVMIPERFDEMAEFERKNSY